MLLASILLCRGRIRALSVVEHMVRVHMIHMVRVMHLWTWICCRQVIMPQCLPVGKTEATMLTDARRSSLQVAVSSVGFVGIALLIVVLLLSSAALLLQLCPYQLGHQLRIEPSALKPPPPPPMKGRPHREALRETEYGNRTKLTVSWVVRVTVECGELACALEAVCR